MFDGNEIPNERIPNDSVLKISKKYLKIPNDSVKKKKINNYPQVYLEQCKYKVKKREMKSFIDYEIDLDSDYESD